MKDGLFCKKNNTFQEIKTFINISLGFIITIINPISWFVYLVIYKLGIYSGEEKNEIKLVCQSISFFVAIISYIAIIIYVIYKIF